MVMIAFDRLVDALLFVDRPISKALSPGLTCHTTCIPEAS